MTPQEKQRGYQSSHYYTNRDRLCADRRLRYATDPEYRDKVLAERKRHRERQSKEARAAVTLRGRLRKYGLTRDEFDTMLKAQGGRCAICRTDDQGRKGNTCWSIDHDHKTLKVRGLLCHGCNSALGYARDDTSILKRMIDYLNTNREVQLGRHAVESISESH